MRHTISALPLLWIVFSTPIPADTLHGWVVSITDGDTLTLLQDDYRQIKVRLDSIDAPEKSQPFGNVAKKTLSDLVFNQRIDVETSKTDRYQRIVGEVWYGGDLINLEMVKRGMAWVYRKYAKNPQYYEMEASAKAQKRGLWSQSNPVAPWEFRHPKVKHVQRQDDSIPGAVCEGKKYCTQMYSCDEAVYYLKTCGVSGLDKDRDGVPCESLCK